MIGETAVYAMPGLLLFAKRGSVMAPAFDADRGVLDGTPPVQVASGGRFLIYDEHVPGRSQDLMMVRREGGTPEALLATEFDEAFAMVSPDGKWVAYRSTDSGIPEVYVRDFVPDRTPPSAPKDSDFHCGR